MYSRINCSYIDVTEEKLAAVIEKLMEREKRIPNAKTSGLFPL